jgi:K+-sensing histidine kinase KdpD
MQRLGHTATVVGPIGVFAVAWATASVRQDMGIANVALLLAAITIVAALINSLAGLLTSVVAAMSLNYFHTEPVHSLRVSGGSDLLAIGLLAGIGVMVSAVTAIRVRRTAVARRGEHADLAAADLHASLIVGGPVVDVWDVAVAAAAAQFGLVDVRLVPAGAGRLPVVSRKPWDPKDMGADHLMLLPEGGAVVQFRDPRHGQQLVLTPRSGMGAVYIDRRVALVFADQIELSLGRLAEPRTSALA